MKTKDGSFILFVIIIILLGAFIIVPSSISATSTPLLNKPNEQFEKTYRRDDFTIAGINIITANSKDVLHILGKPLRIKNGLWYYPGLEIEAGDINHISDFKGTLGTIIVYGNQYSTARGIKNGDPVKKLIEKYGEGFHDGAPPGDYSQIAGTYDYEYSKDGYYIGFCTKGSKVDGIILFYCTGGDKY